MKKYNLPKSFVMGCLTATSLIISGCSTPINTTKTKPQTPEKIADSIQEWWQGDYTNEAQIEAAREDGVPIWKQGQHEGDNPQHFGGYLPVNSYYRAVDMPAFGDRVIYLEEKTFKNNPYRQRIYTVIHDVNKDQVKVKLWYFKDKKAYLGAWQDLSRIKDLTPEDMSPLPDNCDLYVEPTADGRLHMKMPKDQCKFGENIFDYQVILSKGSFWFRDRIVDANSMDVKMSAANFSYHKLDKVKH